MLELFLTICKICAIYGLVVYPLAHIILSLLSGRRKNDSSSVRSAHTNEEHPFVADTPKVNLDKPAMPKRPVGRPRKNPPPDPNAPKRPVGRPRKNQPEPQQSETISDKATAQELWREMQDAWEKRQRESADVCDTILTARGLMPTMRGGDFLTPEQTADILRAIRTA